MMDGPLDFESEDPLLAAPVINQKRKKIIGLDDLLTDYYKEKSKVIERESKRAKDRKNYYSDDDDDVNGKEALLSRQINECHKQIKDMSGDEEITTWGIQVFGNQKPPPSFAFPEGGSWPLLQSFMSDKLNKLVELTTENSEQFLEELLVNGWLSRLVCKRGCVEGTIAKWAYNLMLYSTKETLRMSACDFWCTILSPQNLGFDQGDQFVKIEWYPSCSELKGAIETYGFLFNCSSKLKSVSMDSSSGGPPDNIRSWIKFTSACFHVRSKTSMFSASEAQELLEYVILMCLDRQLLGLLLLLTECMQSAIRCFTDEEWSSSCEEIARTLASRVPKDLNCLRAVECISGGGNRSHHLRSVVAYQTLLACFDNKAADEEGILNLLISINVKGKSCNFFNMYIYLVLTENWVISDPCFEHRPIIYKMLGVYLRNCACQISSTDLRPYASKVRTKASYLLNNTFKK